MILPKDLIDLLSKLNDCGVEYLVIGGYAVAAHGYPRFTQDLDIWVNHSRDNAERVADALDRFGVDVKKISTDLLSRPKTLISFGREPVKIEILTSVLGVEFSKSYKKRLVIDIQGVPVSIINLKDLLKNKKTTGRPEDLADVSRLTRKRKFPSKNYSRRKKR
jgi:predicted nucleotidyltransferase